MKATEILLLVLAVALFAAYALGGWHGLGFAVGSGLRGALPYALLGGAIVAFAVALRRIARRRARPRR